MTDLGNWMQTYTGGRFYPVCPKPEDIKIEDIAHALALTCRFNGHCREFYSVADHSIFVSNLLRQHESEMPGITLVGLLHDAAEAYLGDMVRPLKVCMPDYRDAEDRVEAAIWTRFHAAYMTPQDVLHIARDACLGVIATSEAYRIPLSCHWLVKAADLIALATERRDLFDHKLEWEALDTIERVEPSATPLVIRTPREAESEFLRLFHELHSEVHDD